MNIGKIAGMGISSALTTGVMAHKLCISIYDIGVDNVEACNENNRAWLCDEPANFDRFIKNDVDLNKQYLCSDPDYEFDTPNYGL